VTWNEDILPRALLAGALLVFLAQSRAQAQNACVDAYGSAAVSSFLSDLQKSVAADDRGRVASLVKFPIAIVIKGKRTLLHTRQDLLKYYEVAFDTKVKSFIAKQQFSDLFCNWKGIMIGGAKYG
jgi:hypothetical protein